MTVLAQVLARDGSEMSATETLERALARADHLGVLGGIWDDLVRREQKARFEDVLRDALPGDQADEALGDTAVTWLWRSLREAETCGLDGGQVLRDAVVARSMSGVRDMAHVLDSRVRRRLDGTQPAAAVPWADRVPATGPADIRRYLCELAEAMDERTRRLGEHAAATQPLWARNALGSLPSDPAGRTGNTAPQLSPRIEKGMVTITRPIRSAASRCGPARKPGPPGTARWPRSAGSTASTCEPAATVNCGSAAAPTSGRPRGRRGMSDGNCSSCGSPPGTSP